MSRYKIGFIGFGHMAQIIFQALERARVVSHSQVRFTQRDQAKAKKNEQQFHITATSLKHLIQESDVLFLCVKPQQAAEITSDLQGISLVGKCVISVLAGTTLPTLEKQWGSQVQLIRAMPNIASEVQQGMTVLSFGANCTAEFQQLATTFFSAMGQISIQKEALMDTVCGMSGSGPAFVIRLIDAMAQVGMRQGMSEADALQIAAQTFLGAATLIAQGKAPLDLLVQIATPQGTTAAGLQMMTTEEVDRRFSLAIEAAAKRSQEISAN